MKKSFFSKIRLIGLAIMVILVFSCKKEKTGSQGPQGLQGENGPILTGNLTGHVWLYDQYGTRIYSNLNKITVSIDNTTMLSHADSTGKYIFNNITTGIYSITATDSSYGIDKAQQFQFVGGGDANHDFKLSQIPTFTLTSCTAVDTVINATSNIKVKGTLSADTRARMVVVFAGVSSSVSSAPANYILVYSKTITANATNFNILIPATDFYGAGMASSSTSYFAAYPAAVNFSSTSAYEDFVTGKFFFTAIGATPINFNVTVP